MHTRLYNLTIYLTVCSIWCLPAHLCHCLCFSFAHLDLLVTWHRYFPYTTSIQIYIYTMYMCIYMFGCYCMPPRCVCATWQSHYILSAPCAVSRSCFHMKELSLARYISTRRRRTFIHTQHTHAQHTRTAHTHSTVLASIRDL